MEQRATWADRLGGWYLGYLSVLPAIGTFVLYAVLQLPVNLLIFFVLGAAAVGIYLATTEAYTVVTTSAWRNAVLLLDTPIWMGITVLLGGSLATAVMNNVLIEIVGGMLGVLAVVCTARAPSSGDRWRAAAAVGIPLLAGLWLFAVYVQAQGFTWQQLAVLAGAMVQAAFVQWRWGIANSTQRDVGGYVVIGIVAWMLTLWFVVPVWFAIVESIAV